MLIDNGIYRITKNHPFYQFTRPSVAVSPFSGNHLGLFDSFSVRRLRGQGPQNAPHGDRDSSPGDPPNARAGGPMGPSPAARRPPRWLATATQPTRPNASAAPALWLSTPAASPWRWCLAPQRSSLPPATDAGSPPHPPHSSAHRLWGPPAVVCRQPGHQSAPQPGGGWARPHRAAEATAAV